MGGTWKARDGFCACCSGEALVTNAPFNLATISELKATSHYWVAHHVLGMGIPVLPSSTFRISYAPRPALLLTYKPPSVLAATPL